MGTMINMESKSPWLTDAEQTLWRSWLTINADLPAALHRQLHKDAGLSLPDFEVLVQLSESPNARLKVTDLAKSLTWERSRLSHHVTRMKKRGLVIREDCSTDARSAFVSLTAYGQATLEEAAPGHACTVRSLVFDQLTAEEIKNLKSTLKKIQTNVRQISGSTAVRGISVTNATPTGEIDEQP